ncbi:ATP-binding cassette transporter, putative [Cordyceps militaris CM01]|uniref:ATP-binding cassette transporter, putative n=1 Tax=Cordyceps militaris (strain CM01) TaxID=983644 RepID=G3JBM8_CORMM|nr:ATP-binding cassette transporter, putative [Cordyceps militaris CM01]EGX95333.1 ATP-binding cassette transporter, putative [Cordyceps militaris CM01]
MIRGGLVVVLFDKLLRLAEDPAMETRAMTLMFSDTQKVMSAMNYFHELWAVSSAVCLSLSNKISRRQQKWLAAVEQRLARTKRMLSSLKAVKMLSASDRMHSSITALRRAELAVAWPFRRLQIITTAISYSSITLSPPLVFGVYVAMTSGNHGLDVSKLFSSLTLISLLANPVMHLCQAIPALGAAHGCMARIQTFLELDEHRDRRTTMSPSKDADTPEQVLLSLKNVSLGWLAGKPILHDINLDVKRGSRVAILGRIGAGKSLLLKGILSEVAEISGEIALREDVTLAYCSQTPWLENASAEENWTRRSPSRSPALLGKMIQDYALQNIQELHDYKTGTIGSQGVKLSGGQRQRLSTLPTWPTIYEIDSAGIMTRRPKRELPAETMAADEDSTPEVKEEASTSETCQASSPNSATITIPEPPLKYMDVYKTYLHSVGLGNAVLFLLLGGLYAVAMKFPDVWVQWWSNDSSAGGGGRHSTGYWIGVYAVLECLPLLMLGLWDWHLSYVVVPVAGMSLHTTLLTTVLDAPFAYISSVDAGSIINRFNQDLMFIDSQLPNALFNTVSELFVAVIQVVLVAVASAHALAAVPAVATVLYAVQRFYLRTSKQLRLLDLEAKAVLHSLVSDVAGGAGPSTLRAHGWQADVRAHFLARLDASQEPIYLLFCVQRWLQLVLNLVVMGLVVLVAGVAVALRQRVNPGAVGVAFLNAATLGETLTQFILAYTSLETSLSAIARTTMFSASTPSERDDDERGAKPSSWWPSEGSVRLDNVWARYQLLANSQDASWSLRGISANIPAGQKVSICGRTGSGKSTFILALLRMVDVPIGTAYIGGQDHSQLPLAALRRGYLVVSQDLLDDSTILRDQIDPDGQFTDEQVQEVLTECGLQEVVEASGGLKASAAAVQLSNGETQFLSLARVLLYGSARQGGILLLDEATSRCVVKS